MGAVPNTCGSLRGQFEAELDVEVLELVVVVDVLVVVVVMTGPTQMWLRLSHLPAASTEAPRRVSAPVMIVK